MNTPSFTRIGRLTVLGLLVGLLGACDSSDSSEPGQVTFRISYEVDGRPVAFEDLSFINEAGNTYGLTRIQHYLSGLRLIQADGSPFSPDTVFYVDAQESGTLSFTLNDVPAGDYTAVSFNLGLDETLNVTDGLPATQENVNMIWPDQLGGGYHHIKLEGRWQAEEGMTAGFNVHLGLTNFVQVRNVPASFEIDGNTVERTLIMNVNEWFRTPTVYDFADYPPMIMGNSAAQGLLAGNAADAFRIE